MSLSARDVISPYLLLGLLSVCAPFAIVFTVVDRLSYDVITADHAVDSHSSSRDRRHASFLDAHAGLDNYQLSYPNPQHEALPPRPVRRYHDMKGLESSQEFDSEIESSLFELDLKQKVYAVVSASQTQADDMLPTILMTWGSGASKVQMHVSQHRAAQNNLEVFDAQSKYECSRTRKRFYVN